MKSIETVFAHYAKTRAELHGHASYEGSPDQVCLRHEIPDFFRALLKQSDRANGYIVEGSFGNGNIASVPWVAVFNEQITRTAQEGYYIVLLFSEGMTRCYLSLNQGVTTFEREYPTKTAQKLIRESAQRARAYFDPSPDAILGEIDLGASGHLGKGYELAAIESFRYDRAALPSEQEIAAHFKILLEHYERLAAVVGRTLQSLTPVSEAQYQQAAIEKAQPKQKAGKALVNEPAGGLPVPPKLSVNGRTRYKRDPNVAATALTNANFKCELDANHATFISNSRDLPYVEAHHLIPMGQQPNYAFSLDVTANVVALCPLCHKLLHHAQPKSKKAYLLRLLAHRQGLLSEKKITVSEKTLLSYYGKNLVDDET